MVLHINNMESGKRVPLIWINYEINKYPEWHIKREKSKRTERTKDWNEKREREREKEKKKEMIDNNYHDNYDEINTIIDKSNQKKFLINNDIIPTIPTKYHVMNW